MFSHFRVYVIMRCIWLVLSLTLSLGAQAQKQYWGISSSAYDRTSISFLSELRFGGVVRVDSAAMDPRIVLAFDTAFSTALGAPDPGAGLMQASNGLIYYMTEQRTYPRHTRIIALDPVTDSAWVVAEMGLAAFPWRGQRQFSSMIEGEPGILIDVAQDPFAAARAFRFNTITNTLSVMTTLPSGIDGSGNPVRTSFIGSLYKASNGRIYGGTTGIPRGSPLGAFASLNPVANNFSIVHSLSDPAAGHPIGSTVEWGGKLYVTTSYGGVEWHNSPFNGGWGVIGSYDLATGLYRKEVDLPPSCGRPLRAMVVHGDGKLYGEASSNTRFSSVLFAYDPSTNSVEEKYNYADLGEDVVQNPFSNSGLLSASNGKIYGSFDTGIFEYDPVADTLVLRAPLQFVRDGRLYRYGLTSPLIEICRKPNYKRRPTTDFLVCAGSRFAYDLQNVNATQVVWRRNGEVVPTQTSQCLAFEGITAADAGTWVCTLTNECGTTEPPAITITVQPGSFVAGNVYGDTLLCGNGSSVVLAGNDGGTWNTGATTPTLAVTRPGYYYVINHQACGVSMSPRLRVTHMDSARVPPAVFTENWRMGRWGTTYICPGQTLVLTGNTADPWGLYTPGIWSTGEYGATITVQDTGMYTVSASNACNTETLQVLHVLPAQAPPLPPIAITDMPHGLPVDTYLCGDESLYLYTDDPNAFHVYNAWWQVIGRLGGGPGWAQHFRIDSAGVYHVASFACDEPVDTLTITVYQADAPPEEAPLIWPDVETLISCEAETTFLTSSEQTVYWRWFGRDLQDHRDTSATLEVDWGIWGYYLTAFNGCGESPSDLIMIQLEATPEVSYAQGDTMVCLGPALVELARGTPEGGTYSGSGVVGSMFDPEMAGVGVHQITYSYTEGSCTGYASDTIMVAICMGLEEAEGGRSVAISPNPNAGEFVLLIAGPVQHGSLTIFSSQGKQVGAGRRLTTGINVIAEPQMAAGLYVLRVELDGQVELQRIVVTQH